MKKIMKNSILIGQNYMQRDTIASLQNSKTKHVWTDRTEDAGLSRCPYICLFSILKKNKMRKILYNISPSEIFRLLATCKYVLITPIKQENDKSRHLISLLAT